MVYPSCLILDRQPDFHPRRLAKVSYKCWIESYLIVFIVLIIEETSSSILVFERTASWDYLNFTLLRGFVMRNSCNSFSFFRFNWAFYASKLIEYVIVSTPLFSFSSKNSASWFGSAFEPSLFRECKKLCQSFLPFSFFFCIGTSTSIIYEAFSWSLTLIRAMKIEESLDCLSSSNFETLKSRFLLLYNASFIAFRYYRYSLILIQVQS